MAKIINKLFLSVWLVAGYAELDPVFFQFYPTDLQGTCLFKKKEIIFDYLKEQ